MPDVVVDSTVVSLPSLGADMDTGTVIEWRVAVGDRVDRGDVVALVSTDKSDIDVETWDVGVVSELIAIIGEEIDVGAPLLRLADTATETARDQEEPFAVASVEVFAADRTAASPMARRLAAERGVALSELEGTGPDGAVVAADVTHAPTEPVHPAPSPAVSTEPGTAADSMRRAIADRMTRSNLEIPHYHLERDIDVGRTLEWLEEYNADLPLTERVLPAALLACAAAHAASAVDRLNGTWGEEGLEISPTVDLAVVVSLRSGGLVTPTVTNASELSPAELMATMRDMVTRARKGQLRGRWMVPSSIAITNLGDNGADRVSGVIFPPHVALVGFGRISQRPWVVDSEVVARPVVTASLAADHRASDGADGSRFLAVVAERLEHPRVDDVVALSTTSAHRMGPLTLL